MNKKCVSCEYYYVDLIGGGDLKLTKWPTCGLKDILISNLYDVKILTKEKPFCDNYKRDWNYQIDWVKDYEDKND